METTTKVGLFLAAYQIGGGMPGAPTFTVHFTVNTPHEQVNGSGHITQATNPPVNVETHLNGTYTYMTVMPDVVHILVNATGHQIVKWPSHGGIGPAIPANAHLQMVLEGDWKSGTANYKYMDSEGQWHSVTNAPVQLITPTVLS